MLSRRDHAGDSTLGAELVASVRRLAANPMPWAIVLGAVWGVLGLSLPGPVDTVIDMLATAATPVALFTIGAVLARSRPTTQEQRPGLADVGWLATLKLLAHPLLVWGLGSAALALGLPLDREALTALILLAALPAAANVSILAERFGADSSRVAQVILISTVVSFATFTAAAALLT